MSQLQRIQETREALIDALAERNWDAIVIDQQNLGFTPHAIATSLVNSMP